MFARFWHDFCLQWPPKGGGREGEGQTATSGMEGGTARTRDIRPAARDTPRTRTLSNARPPSGPGAARPGLPTEEGETLPKQHLHAGPQGPRGPGAERHCLRPAGGPFFSATVDMWSCVDQTTPANVVRLKICGQTGARAIKNCLKIGASTQRLLPALAWPPFGQSANQW